MGFLCLAVIHHVHVPTIPTRRLKTALNAYYLPVSITVCFPVGKVLMQYLTVFLN